MNSPFVSESIISTRNRAILAERRGVMAGGEAAVRLRRLRRRTDRLSPKLARCYLAAVRAIVILPQPARSQDRGGEVRTIARSRVGLGGSAGLALDEPGRE